MSVKQESSRLPTAAAITGILVGLVTIIGGLYTAYNFFFAEEESNPASFQNIQGRETPNDAGIEVVSVVPGSAEASAGILPGDIITKVDNTTVRNQQDMLAALGNTRAGDNVDVTVRRGGASVVKTVETDPEGYRPPGFQ